MSKYVTLQLAKNHLNVDQSFTGDDTYIEYLVDVAAETVARHICCVLEDLENDGELPKPIIHAILLYVGDLYNSREGNAYGVTATQVPFTYDYLLSLYKNYGDTTSVEFQHKALDEVAKTVRIDDNRDLVSDFVPADNSLSEKAKKRIADNLSLDQNGNLKTKINNI